MEVTALLVSLEETKAYLKIEYDDEDDLLLSLIASAEDLCATILRKDLPDDDTVRVAVLYASAISLIAVAKPI